MSQAVEGMLDWSREVSPSADARSLDVRDVPVTGASELSVEY